MGVACVGLAVGTVLQALPRGPVGSGFLAPPVFSATYLAPSVLAAEIGGLRLVFGMTVFAGAPGTPGMSISPSMVGISAATGATSRAIAFVAAVLLVIAASPRLSGFFMLVPPEVAGGLLVFTASFLITGGMEIMMSRRADTRAVYVIGISTMLALGRTFFPHYFDQLSPALRSVAGSSLALGLSAALVLTLAFRLGTRQRADSGWNGSEASIDAALGFLRRQAQGWKLPADVAETAASHLRDVLEYLVRTHPAGLEGRLRLIYDGLALRVEALYQGSAAAYLPPARASYPPARDDGHGALENEEAAVMLGLRSFLSSLPADRKLLRLRHGEVMVRLGYAA